MRMLNTFLREMMTQSKTDLSFGILLIVFSGLERSVVTEIYKLFQEIPQHSQQLDSLQSLSGGSFAEEIILELEQDLYL